MPNLSFSQRSGMRPASVIARAYFAPVDRVSSAPSIFDPALTPVFDPDAPPSPWICAGPVRDLKRIAPTVVEPMRSGPLALTKKQFRQRIEAHVEFDFVDWGKLQMAISAGCQQMNLLAQSVGSPAVASGGPAAPAVATLPGSTATEVLVGAGVINQFSAGDLIAVDSDYQQQTGYVGSGVPGAYVKSAADVQFDPDYIRRVTFRVGRVSGKTATGLQLAQPLIGGAPPADAAVQKVIGFLDREGGTFFQEWSALFLIESETGARIYYHYPRLQPLAAASEGSYSLAVFEANTLRARMTALPANDLNDGEQVVCYRSFVPAANTAIY